MTPPFLTILGGGPAGLAAGHFAHQRQWSCQILEAGERVGGNCVTLQRGEHRFDLGAHRFHDKDADVTAVVRGLLGQELRRVSAPSAICLNGQFLPFPPQTSDLLRYLGPARFASAAAGAAVARLRGGGRPRTLESYAINAYGRSLADMFLLNYSEKLWGVPCSTLSPRVSGGRLSGLKASTLWRRPRQSDAHLEGTFYYPTGGYGRIVARLAESCAPEAIHTNTRVTRLLHDGARITHVEVNGRDTTQVDQVVATIPLTVATRLLDPPIPEIARLAEGMTFRCLVLSVWLLDKPSVTSYATVYFPDASVPFTRVSEPRNRSAAMSPAGQTSLVVEIPCFRGDEIWTADDEAVARRVAPTLTGLGWIDERSVIGTHVVRIPDAYPVLTGEAEDAAAAIVDALRRFSNLHFIGRNGLFHYSWLHSVMRMAKTLVDELQAPAAAR